jgi:aspartyl-tRNA(Asn)/glutamyl-tRNA(Gln) amidotransferase subunit A
VATTALVLGVLAGTSYDLSASSKPLRVALLIDQLADSRLDPELAAITRSALARLEAAGVQITERDGTALAQLEECLGDIIMVEAWRVHGGSVREDPEHYGAATRRLFQAAATVPAERRSAALRRRDALLPAAAALLDGVDVVLGPAAPYAAPKDTPPMDTPEGEIEGIFTGPYNVSGQPAIVLPCGTTSDGLPVALQLAAAVGDDAGLLRAAAVIETILAS